MGKGADHGVGSVSMEISSMTDASVVEKKKRGRPPKNQSVRQFDRLKVASGDSDFSLEAQEKLIEINKRAEAARLTGLHVSAFVVSDNSSSVFKNMDLVANFKDAERKEAAASNSNQAF